VPDVDKFSVDDVLELVGGDRKIEVIGDKDDNTSIIILLFLR